MPRRPFTAVALRTKNSLRPLVLFSTVYSVTQCPALLQLYTPCVYMCNVHVHVVLCGVVPPVYTWVDTKQRPWDTRTSVSRLASASLWTSVFLIVFRIVFTSDRVHLSGRGGGWSGACHTVRCTLSSTQPAVPTPSTPAELPLSYSVLVLIVVSGSGCTCGVTEEARLTRFGP